jgi:hypothetical protein
VARNRASAKKAGADFEIKMTAALVEHLEDDNIVRLNTAGQKDPGDIGNVRLPNGGRVCVEAKNYGGEFKVGTWLGEAEKERVNYGAVAGVVIAKRKGTTAPLEQVVFMTVRDFVTILKGSK